MPERGAGLGPVGCLPHGPVGAERSGRTGPPAAQGTPCLVMCCDACSVITVSDAPRQWRAGPISRADGNLSGLRALICSEDAVARRGQALASCTTSARVTAAGQTISLSVIGANRLAARRGKMGKVAGQWCCVEPLAGSNRLPSPYHLSTR